MFAGGPVEVRRLGLARDQVDEFNPPPNFAKETDRLTPQYQAVHGEQCWELDALSPEVIAGLILAALDDLIDRIAGRRATRAKLRDWRPLSALLADGMKSRRCSVVRNRCPTAPAASRRRPHPNTAAQPGLEEAQAAAPAPPADEMPDL